nr:unnamed protein product [Spirometra erinaceieuropaei]
MALSLPFWGVKFAVAVTAHASQITDYDKVKDKFYENPHTLRLNVPKANKLFVLGEFNSRQGTEHTAWEESAGPDGVSDCNDNKTVFLLTCTEHRLLFHLPLLLPLILLLPLT